MSQNTPKGDDDDGGGSTVIIINPKINAIVRKVWAHPIGRPVVCSLISFILGAVIL